jgi:protein-disulfide isomerase
MPRLPRFAPTALSAAVLAGAMMSAPVQALDLSKMSDDERQAFREEVRAYLMENPEVILEAVNALEEKRAQQQELDDVQLVVDNAADIFEDGFSWIGGNLDGDLTVVEFVDYRCGYCRKAHAEVKELLETDGNIRIIMKEFPILGEASMDSSRFAVATKIVAGDEAYAQMHDALIAYKGSTKPAALARLAEGLGLDPKPILAALDSDEVTDHIRKTHELAAKLKINGTPTFVFGDQLLRGYVPLDAMREVVKQKRG